MDTVIDLYVNQKMSIPDVSEITGIARSTIRYRLSVAGVLRSRAESIRLAAAAGKLKNNGKPKGYKFSDEAKQRMSEGHRASKRVQNAKGVSFKPNGYLEYTTGEHKGRSVHVVTMEKIIGRRITAEEVVHHKDENRANNDPGNLQLMTRSEHAAHHGLENHIYRDRNIYGQFE